MSNFDSEYFFIRKPKGNERIPSLEADEDTSMRNYAFEALPLGSPLVFLNSWRERNKKKGISEKIGEVLFEGADLLVSDRIRMTLLHRDIAHLHMHPSIYIDDVDRWHENFWYLTFTKRFDCWDRKTSVYLDKPIGDEGEEIFHVEKFHLNDELLRKTPVESRLLFKMGGSIEPFVTVHRTLASLFSVEGVELQKLSDY